MTTRTVHEEWDDKPAPSMAATDLLREPPATPRGARTRAALVAAARTVFERSGYLDARLTDITKEANCSTGSFYTYFDNKEQVFAAVLEVAQEDMMHPGMKRVQDTDDPYAVLEASNRAYLEAYRRNAKLMGAARTGRAHRPGVRGPAASAGRRVHRAQRAGGIAELQARGGIADKELDPMLASRALSGMVSRLAYNVFVASVNGTDGTPVDFDDVVFTTTRIWANGLRFPERS